MLEMAINNVEVGSLKDRVHIVTFCGMHGAQTFWDFSEMKILPMWTN